MSVLDDDDIFLSREGPVELYNKSVRWLQEHCSSDIIYEKGTDDKFKSPLITDSGSWLSIDGLSSKVVLKWDDKRGGASFLFRSQTGRAGGSPDRQKSFCGVKGTQRL